MIKEQSHHHPLHMAPASQGDLPFVRALLERSGLPLDIIDERKGELWVFSMEQQLVGCGAFEFYGADALLRSVAVSEAHRGNGTGSELVDLLEAEAVARGVSTTWLLTETAAPFFRKKGYDMVDRAVVVNKGILDSAEFVHLCASTAVCMRKRLVRE